MAAPSPALAILLIFGSAVLGAIPPMLGRWNQHQLHLFVAFGAGVFLGAVFFHLYPEALAIDSSRLTNASILAGFILVLFLERVLIRHRGHNCDEEPRHRHQVIGMSAFLGLGIHSLTAGLALGAVLPSPDIAWIVLLAILTHKAIAAFSLATVFRLSGFSLRRALILLVIFSLTTPIGALAAIPFFSDMDPARLAVPTALAAGSFIYVATVDLLPEAFHEQDKRLSAFVALALGLLAMMAFAH